MLNNSDEKDKLEEKDLLWTKYPEEQEIAEHDIRGIYIGNYFNWDPNSHVKLVIEYYGWKPAEKPFERTYWNFSKNFFFVPETFSKYRVILICPPSTKVYAKAKNEDAAIQYPEYSANPLTQKPKILEAIPIKIKPATKIKKKAAIYPEYL